MNLLLWSALAVLLSIVVVQGVLIHQLRSVLRHLVSGSFSFINHLLEDRESIYGTDLEANVSPATMSTSPLLSSESWSPQQKGSNSLTDKERLHCLGRSENSGVIYFGKNSPGCPTCNTLLRWEVMHSKPWLVIPQSLRQGEVSSPWISDSVECRSWPPITPPT